MKKNIIIIGGGFGGLRTALSLGYDLKHAGLLDRYAVKLVDRHEYHTYTPLLHEIAVPPAHPSRTIDEERVSRRFKALLRKKPVDFVHGEAANIDLENGVIRLSSGEELDCEYLVLAPGSEINYFGIPGLQEHSMSLKGLAEAKRTQTALSELLLSDPAARIMVGGGGPTGAEVAAEIKFNHPRAKVAIVEATPAILSGFSPRFRNAAEERLRRLGVRIIADEAIASVTAGMAISKNKREMPFDLLIWTGGVRASGFLSALPIKTGSNGLLEVDLGMRCLPRNADMRFGPKVYALGDSVCIYHPKTGRPIPGVAPAAIDQGEVVVENIFAAIEKAEGFPHISKRKMYKAKEHPYALPLGGRWAVARIGPIVMTGVLAWLFQRAIEIDYSLSLR